MLGRLGWGAQLEEAFARYSAYGCVPARIAVQHRGGYRVYASHAPGHVPGTVPQTGLRATRPEEAWPRELAAVVSPKLRREAAGPADFPAVGDWVALELPAPGHRATIHAVLPRRTVFLRRAPGERGAVEEQVVAANVDTVFVVAALPGELNLRQLERYLVLARESGAEPAIVLTKADLCDDAAPRAAEVEAVAPGVPVHVVSNVTGEGIPALAPYFAGHRTVAALGPSGVGKSSLINRLLGAETQETGEVGRRGKGRHTTTRRELILLPGGGLFLDTPGMRELRLWESDLDEAFADVTELAAHCRFGDCRHETEPGCAVRAAVEAGRLEAARLESYCKLRQELEELERQLERRAARHRRRLGRGRRRPGR